MKWIALYFLIGILLTTIGIKLMIDEDTMAEVTKQYPKSQIISAFVVITIIWPYFMWKLIKRTDEKLKEERNKNDRS